MMHAIMQSVGKVKYAQFADAHSFSVQAVQAGTGKLLYIDID